MATPGSHDGPSARRSRAPLGHRRERRHPATGRCFPHGLVAALAGAALALAAQLAAPRAAYADPVRVVETDADNLQSQVRVTVGDIRNSIAQERRYPLDRRYIEASLAYERANYPVAAVLCYDLVWNPQFQSSRDYYEALYMLGDSLYRLRNYVAARRYLDSVLKRQGGRHFESALRSLVDIAIRIRAFDAVNSYASFLGAVPPGDRRSDLLYQFGRSYLAARRFDEARKYLSQVRMGEKAWAAARFYMAAIHVQEQKFEEAGRAFQDVIQAGESQDKASRPTPVVLAYATMGMARLHMHEKRFKESVAMYKRIDRASPLYEDALFELAACHVASGDPKSALASLDLLLLTVSDDAVAVEAAVLRGRISLMLKEYDAADGSYKEVVDKYAAISGEMTRFAQSTQLLENFFAWLLLRGGDDYSVVRPVSERVARYIERDPDMARVIELFDEMAGEKRDVKESQKLAETLTVALRSNARLEMFPGLRDKWLVLLESENRLVALGQRMVELLHEATKGKAENQERARIEALLEINRKLYDAFRKMPATARQYSQRQSRIDSQINEMAAQMSVLRAELSALRDELQSIEKLLNERLYGADGVALSKEREAEVRKGLEEEKHELRRLAREIESLATNVEIDATRFGTGDDVNADEARLRGALLANQRLVQLLLGELARRAGRDAALTSRLQAVRNRIDQTFVEIGMGFREIDARVQEKTRAMTQVLETEKNNIADYQVAVARYEAESRSLARDVGYALIRRAQGRLADVLLEADLGLVDVAWQRKMDKNAKVRELQDERAGKLRSLQETLESLQAGDDEEDAP